MLRVRDANRDIPATSRLCSNGGSSRFARLAALGGLGLALGAGSVIATVSWVAAEDNGGVREVQRHDAASRQQERRSAAYASTSAYAPARNLWTLPLFGTRPDGRIVHPQAAARNPLAAAGEAAPRDRARRKTAAVGLDTTSGAANVARTICVRMCDGFHAPIGYLRAASDLKAHEALCRAANPGLPVKVFKVAAGAATIAGAVAADGRSTYGALPVAYGHEKSSDPACRPAVVKAGERRVALMRDFTLRAGDSIVTSDGVTTFSGSAQWPYKSRDFRDFRASRELSAKQRRQIDDQVGISRREAQERSLRRDLRQRHAEWRDERHAVDFVSLRGTIDPANRASVRVVGGAPLPVPR